MASERQEWFTARGREACARRRRTEEVLDVRRKDDALKPRAAGTRSLRVLAVDDDRDTADSVCMLVKMWRHDVRPAYDGAMALEIASTYHPDVMLLDLAMPRMGGYELARRLRRQPRFQESLLIAITGYADPANRRLSEEAGFDLFLRKPVEPPILETLLLLEQARLVQSPASFPTPAPRAFGILVVDDEQGVRDVLNAGLRSEGFAVGLAANGRDALDVYRRQGQTIDVVLLDVRMPGLDGPRTLAALQELNPQVRCCFMSGDLGSYTEERLRSLGAAAVFPKPFQMTDVAHRLWELASKADVGTASVW